ncbi:MAG: anthranilate phosphoribosyltransferase [Candidatus Omnitrophota bacterium]
MDIKRAIGKVVLFENLTAEETRSVFDEIMSGHAAAAQIGAFITALRMKGETVDEITGAALAMREKALKINPAGAGAVLDTCGTGGSGTGVFNVSTASAFVIAACGVKVAKHGNRAASSKCGSADVLESLGVRLDIPPESVAGCIDKINIGFLFAPVYHGAMKHAAAPRKEIGIRTIFNILGPLSNPASADRQVLGVYDRALTEVLANVLRNLGTKRAYVVSGDDGLDEVTITGSTAVSELKNGSVRSFMIEPEQSGIKRASIEDIKGGTVKENAQIVKDVLSGKKGPKRDIVLINAGLGLMASEKAEDLKEAVLLAAEAIDSGAAMKKLEELIAMTNGSGCE